MKLSTKLARLVAKLQATLKTEGGVGFTMIELLIVIAILGILAVAVLAAINPVEQINRGRDTQSKSDAEQLISAIDRFNAFRGYYPWVDSMNTDFDVDWEITHENIWETVNIPGCRVLDRLAEGSEACEGTDELKSSYTQRITASDYRHLRIYNAGETGNSTYVCFEPRSKAFMDEARDRCLGEDGPMGPLPSDFPDDIACDDVAPLVCLP